MCLLPNLRSSVWLSFVSFCQDMLRFPRSCSLGIGVASGEHCQNRVIFKQFLQLKGLQFCQIDSCRMGGLNEVLAVLLMAAKFGGIPTVIL